MTPSKNTVKAFHQHLGKLFYAIAATDNCVREEELNKLIEIVKKDWLASNYIEDHFKTEAETSIINTFKWLHSTNEYDAETCFNSFIVFINKHTSLLTKDMKSLIFKTARAIATSFSNVNKSELIMLAKLNIELNKYNCDG